MNEPPSQLEPSWPKEVAAQRNAVGILTVSLSAKSSYLWGPTRARDYLYISYSGSLS